MPEGASRRLQPAHLAPGCRTSTPDWSKTLFIVETGQVVEAAGVEPASEASHTVGIRS
jgi:hypothetical protein